MSKVSVQTLLDLMHMLSRLDALTPDQDASVLYFDGDLPIYHHDEWLVGIAVFEDDQWWVDFTNYGADRPTRTDSRPDVRSEPIESNRTTPSSEEGA